MRLRRIYPIVKTHSQEYVLQNCTLILDGKSFFVNSYENSGCKYLLGGEYDRYADYLKRLLENFKKANVRLFVVMNGVVAADIERRLELHQILIDTTDAITYNNIDTNFSEPAFVKDVNRQILEELDIEYTVCNGNPLSEIVNLAKTFNCAVLTNFVECCLFDVPCISNASLKFNGELNCFDAKIYEPKFVKSLSGTPYSYEKMSVFLVLMDENNEFLQVLIDLLPVKPNIVGIRFRNWMFKRTPEFVLDILSKRLRAEEYQRFQEDQKVMLQKLKYTKQTMAVRHFKSSLKKSVITDENFFDYALASGKLPTAYINLRNINLFSGSWLMVDKDRDDAMLPSMEIVGFAHQVLTGFKNLDITFVGRAGAVSSVRRIQSSELFKRQLLNGRTYFDQFLETALPGFHLDLLANVADDCKMLITALVYHAAKVNKEFARGAHSVLLSYVMLSYVTRRTGLLKRSNFSMDNRAIGDLPGKECLLAAGGLVEYFYVRNGRAQFHRSSLHDFAEFEHVLAQMNYLNQLCGELQGTVYHRTYNATFIHNVYHLMKDADPMKVVEELLADCPSVLSIFRNVVRAYNDGVNAVRI